MENSKWRPCTCTYNHVCLYTGTIYAVCAFTATTCTCMSSSHDTGKGVEQSSIARERESKVQSLQESEDRLRRENGRETQTPSQVEVGTYTCTC